MTSLEDIVSLCKRRGFVFAGSDIYGGLAGTWDYGPLGILLKRNIMNLWWETFVTSRDDMFGVDAAILMNQKVWQASGHASGFNDPMIECSKCHSRFREDHVDQSKACIVCGAKNSYGQPRQFNMMFKTSVGPVDDENSISYLRPETAQGIFTNYKNVVDTFYPDLPFGIAQMGKAFRNEISPRDFVFRSREFEQMEIEYFVSIENWEKHFDSLLSDIYKYLELVGLQKKDVHELEVPAKDRAHYSKRTIDIEYDFPFGKKELLGLAYRTDYDLKAHQESSGKNQQYRPKDGGAPFIPHVIEPSFGVERLIMAVLTNAYTEDEVEGDKRTLLKLPYNLAPYKVAVSPLLKNKPELVNKAREVYGTLKKEIGNVMWDDNGNIGKRYRRQDEIGTPFCVTIDFQTLEDNTVTVRDRDSTKQKRSKISDLVSVVARRRRV